MKQEYQSAYRKLNADPAFRDRLIRTLEEHQEPRRTRPRWMVPVALAACLILLFGLGVPTLKRVLQPIETVSSAPTAKGGKSDGTKKDPCPPVHWLHDQPPQKGAGARGARTQRGDQH